MKSNTIKDERLKDVSGIQKAAMLMVALNIEAASAVFRYLDPVDIESLSAEIERKSVV